MITFQKYLESIGDTQEIINRLKQLRDADQSIRKEYQGYLDKYAGPAPNYPNWQQATQHWIHDKKTSADDIFDDKQRLAEAKLIIQQNIKQIQTNQSLEDMAWLLTQHMDHDVEFQKWFLSQIKPGTTNHNYLFDRVAVNTGQPQQFGTQNTNI